MKNIPKIITILIFISIPVSVLSAEMILNENNKFFQAYYTQNDQGWKVELKGKVLMTGLDYKAANEVTDKAQDKTNASVRLYNNLGIDVDDLLYIVNDNNLIIGKLKISSIFYTKSFGYILVGKGNMKFANAGDRVVHRINTDYNKKAVVLNGKGDYYLETGQQGKAISFYKNVLEKDKNNPEAHIALGYIYLNDDIIEYANHEFMQVYKSNRKPYDNEDKYLLYKGLAEVRYKQVYYLKLPEELRNKYINEGISFSKYALSVNPESKEVNFYLANFYYKNTNPDDVTAKDKFLKVIALDQNNIEAHVALAELYEKHDNKSKALFFAEKALVIDPINDRAKNIYKKYK